ncbi:expressed unknown protein [Seminavis robusta]|uniref:Uncharacterized protein n=1 Tax=Seminavis robusta TaxID=568900 RepID=A0A9N8EPG3_9STRA|nr:expressed unknown protein [Seminavis robusta]|eukprot:Sro1372_g267190.1 n/a (170) ;mRNA; f:19764-20273
MSARRTLNLDRAKGFLDESDPALVSKGTKSTKTSLDLNRAKSFLQRDADRGVRRSTSFENNLRLHVPGMRSRDARPEMSKAKSARALSFMSRGKSTSPVPGPRKNHCSRSAKVPKAESSSSSRRSRSSRSPSPMPSKSASRRRYIVRDSSRRRVIGDEPSNQDDGIFRS